MNGWIKTYRELINHWIWNNDKYLKGWLWFLLRANHCDNKILMGSDLYDLKRGEFVTSIYRICEATGMTSQSTRTFLALLEKDKMINKQTTNKLTKITICNYEHYQGEQQTNNKQTTNKQQTNNKRATTDNNIKNEKNEKKYNNIPPTFEEIKLRIGERQLKNILPEVFFAHYESNGWKVGKNKMKNWDSALTYWEHNKQFKDENNIRNNQRGTKSVNQLWNKEN